MRVTNLGWCQEFAEMWERTGIKPTPVNLREVLERLAKLPDPGESTPSATDDPWRQSEADA
jgi:hypothetical protein